MQNLIPDLLNSDTAPLPYTNASLTSHSQKSCKYHSKRELLLLQLNSRTIATMYYQHLPGNPTFCKRISTSLAHSQDTNPPENSLKKKKNPQMTVFHSQQHNQQWERVIMGSEALSTQGSGCAERKRNELLQQYMPPQNTATPKTRGANALLSSQKQLVHKFLTCTCSPAQLRMKWPTLHSALNTSGKADYELSLPNDCHYHTDGQRLSPLALQPPLTVTHSGCPGVVAASHRQQQHLGLVKLPVNEAKIASKLTKGQATPQHR